MSRFNRRLKEPFGKAGLTVAILALVMALVGGAYAAGGLTKSQEKQVTKIAKKYAGKPGEPGPAGTNGTNGKDGAAGAKGEQGTQGIQGNPGANGAPGSPGSNGKSVTATEIPTGEFECEERGGAMVEEEGGVPVEVCNGEKGPKGDPWTAGGTLPKGATETGAWQAGDGNTAIGSFSPFTVVAVGAISFPIPLAAPLESEPECNENGHEPCFAQLNPAGYDGTTTGGSPEEELEHEHCPGTVTVPKAKEGFLCVYVTEYVHSISFAAPFLARPDESVSEYESGGFASIHAHTGTTGARLIAVPASSEFSGSGTWAVTGG